ncbi:flagellar basal-body MS-ring/collar protein FliF [Niallia taxi]|uniref:flagellar basal-body MS-ring/collar protein FliF n=1 Tax=Niallia taxi TaxID=2499688 RepID=UPI0015F5D3B0|nr:flagellar basal-body MS-ring/collar protein FliF [Niallia taxi]
MNERLAAMKTKATGSWNGLSKRTKIIGISSFVLTILALSLFLYTSNKVTFVPIYSDLKEAESGDILAVIKEKGIEVEVSPDGSTISVPEEVAAELKVELAAQGLPKSGQIDYEAFSGFGMTDRQFGLVERDQVQKEIQALIENISGVEQADVVITLPKESVWLNDDEATATASIVIHTEPGLQLEKEQINGLYHLIAKSVPNLPVEEIVIMDSSFQAYDYNTTGTEEDSSSLTAHQQQRQIQKDIERDIQRQLQTMLGTVLGHNHVVVSVFSSVDFTKEQREEKLVEPVQDGEGLDISIQRIQESYSGEGATPDAVAGTGETDIAGYPSTEGSQNSEYEKLNETINKEVNRISKQIVAAPYEVRDLTIHVGVEPPKADDPASLTPEIQAEIENILKQTVATALSANEVKPTDEELDKKITVVAQEFQGGVDPTAQQQEETTNQLLLYAAIALAVAAIAGLAYMFFRRKKARRLAEEEEARELEMKERLASIGFDDLGSFDKPETAETIKKQRLEDLANERPEEFVGLLRAWIAEQN